MKTITRLSSVALALLATSLTGCSREQTTSTTETVASSPQVTPSTSGSFPEQAPVSTAPAPPVSATAAQTPPFTLKAVNTNSKTAPAVSTPEDLVTALAKVPRVSPAELKSEVDAGKVLV
ncbi:MAG TPA: hypothetical protein VHL58_08700, partial [Thermoanaerobaculia bacterium]|nr:hypothetical protein [Thermoanaerobaculia bacterium]